MRPNLSPPVKRPSLYKTPLLLDLKDPKFPPQWLLDLGADPLYLDPEKHYHAWALILGASPFAYGPQRYIPPVCQDGCYVFSGSSFARCVAGCR